MRSANVFSLPCHERCWFLGVTIFIGHIFHYSPDFHTNILYCAGDVVVEGDLRALLDRITPSALRALRDAEPEELLPVAAELNVWNTVEQCAIGY